MYKRTRFNDFHVTKANPGPSVVVSLTSPPSPSLVVRLSRFLFGTMSWGIRPKRAIWRKNQENFLNENILNYTGYQTILKPSLEKRISLQPSPRYLKVGPAQQSDPATPAIVIVIIVVVDGDVLSDARADIQDLRSTWVTTSVWRFST